MKSVPSSRRHFPGKTWNQQREQGRNHRGSRNMVCMKIRTWLFFERAETHRMLSSSMHKACRKQSVFHILGQQNKNWQVKLGNGPRGHTPGKSFLTPETEPFILQSSRRYRPEPRLALGCLGTRKMLIFAVQLASAARWYMTGPASHPPLACPPSRLHTPPGKRQSKKWCCV